MRRLLAGPRSALASSPSAEGTCRRQVSALHRVANELQLPNELWRRDEPSRCRAAWWRCPWCNSRFWRPWAPGIEWRCGLGWPALLATCAAAWVRRQWLDPLRLDQQPLLSGLFASDRRGVGVEIGGLGPLEPGSPIPICLEKGGFRDKLFLWTITFISVSAQKSRKTAGPQGLRPSSWARSCAARALPKSLQYLCVYRLLAKTGRQEPGFIQPAKAIRYRLKSRAGRRPLKHR